MKMSLMPLWILLAVALILVGCSGWPIGRTAEEQTHDSPDVVVQRFYTWYLDDSQAEPKDALQSGVLSEELSARMKSALPGNSVNFVCAQDFPESVSVGLASIEGDQASVPVETSWGGRLQIRLKSIEGAWLIDDVQCIH
jgi:hypothetical protein